MGLEAAHAHVTYLIQLTSKSEHLPHFMGIRLGGQEVILVFMSRPWACTYHALRTLNRLGASTLQGGDVSAWVCPSWDLECVPQV